MGRHRHQAQLGQIDRGACEGSGQLEQAPAGAGDGLLLLAVLGHQRRVVPELDGGAPQQQRCNGYTDEFLHHIHHNAQGAGGHQAHLIQGGGHDQGGRAASGEDGGHGQGHLLSNEGIADQDDCQSGSDDADQGSDDHFPLPPQLGKVDGGTQGDNEDSRDDIAEAGDLGILDHRAGQNAAPEAGQEQDCNAQHSGKDCL